MPTAELLVDEVVSRPRASKPRAMLLLERVLRRFAFRFFLVCNIYALKNTQSWRSSVCMCRSNPFVVSPQGAKPLEMRDRERGPEPTPKQQRELATDRRRRQLPPPALRDRGTYSSELLWLGALTNKTKSMRGTCPHSNQPGKASAHSLHPRSSCGSPPRAGGRRTLCYMGTAHAEGLSQSLPQGGVES